MSVEFRSIPVYEATTNSDSDEGRGSTVTLGWFLTLEDAQKCAKGKGVWGADGRVVTHHKEVALCGEKVFLLGSEVQKTYQDPKKIRDQALSKLTEEEKEALGLK